MRAWPMIGLLILIGCSLDTAPDLTGSKPGAEEYPDWRPNTLDASVKPDASAVKTAAVSRDAGSSAPHVDAAVSRADTGAPAQTAAVGGSPAAVGGSPAAGSGAMNEPSPPPSAAAMADAATPSAPVDAGVPVTMTMTATPPPAPPPAMNKGEGKDKGEPPGKPGEEQGDEKGNHGKGEDARVDAGMAMTEQPPAEGSHPAESASPASSVDVVSSILNFAVGVVGGSVATQLVIDVLALTGAPNDTLVAAVLTEGLHALDDSHACRGSKGAQCSATCELLASDCHVCANDASCLDALASTCGKDSVRACE